MLRRILLLLLLPASFCLKATTWDEPWQDKIMKESESFVLGRISDCNEEKGFKLEVLRTLAGAQIEGKVEVNGFFLLHLCSTSGGHGPEFHFDGVDSIYLFLKKGKKGYELPTPTSGFAFIYKDGKVKATYRHSYHQCMIPAAVYESSMIAIFDQYHGKSYNKEFVNGFVKKWLDIEPKGFGEGEIDTFFMQHTALEMIYHLGMTLDIEKAKVFLNKQQFHINASVIRALGNNNDEASKTLLLDVMKNMKTEDFVRVLCVWAIEKAGAAPYKEMLAAQVKDASEKDTGFGGNIMDPRVCTHFPSYKSALETLLKKL